MTTELEIEDAVLLARRIVQQGRPATAGETELLARALLTVTGSVSGPPDWTEPADLWLDRFRVWHEKGTWAAAWGPTPFDEGFRGSRRLLAEFLKRERLQEEKTEPSAKPPAEADHRRPTEPAEAPELTRRRSRPKGGGRKKAETVG